MIPVMIEESKISANKFVHRITKEERKTFVKLLKNFVITIKGFRPIEEAIITSGALQSKEIYPQTMQSKKVKGLYFAGEIIDVDAYTGGFNLQIAYSTGYKFLIPKRRKVQYKTTFYTFLFHVSATLHNVNKFLNKSHNYTRRQDPL